QQNATVEQLKSLETEFKNIREAFLNSMESMQAVLDRKLNGAFDTVVKNMADLGKGLNDGQDRQQKATVECLNSLENAFVKIREDIVNTLEKIREDNTIGLDKMRSENQSSLDKINQTVNEKLQKTLNDRITQSFELVNKRLTEVYEGLGEMKNVASGVSDLKNVLSNVKSRGIMGEIQLGAILRDILAPEQYETQFKIDPNSTEMVDFAVRLPGLEDGKFVFLPIDSKFPGDSYASLVNAYDSGDPADIKQKRSILERELKRCAKSIHDKYIIPPYSTDFAIMFLPFEGLYAEVVNMGLVEVLQAEYRVNITGPSTMAAMLNSLQMGFRTLAIQKKSGEVWKILEAAKKEFSNFESVLSKTRDRLRQADDELEKLIGTRTRAINRKLQTVSTLDANEDSSELLELT
ncbi:MAG: DNA recombination protein RmuC, partial [Proteobacteria bacterium]|nr:DNA recombination protein RmuC [Pseudomonadota bacterium]